MFDGRDFAVMNISDLRWPTSVSTPSKRLRLFVAADSTQISTDTISDFASAALNNGTVYFCVWGHGCERFHDIVGEVILSDGRFHGVTASDLIMTTWHDHESLQEALSSFAACGVPADGFVIDASFGLVVCVDSERWAATAKELFRSAGFAVP